MSLTNPDFSAPPPGRTDSERLAFVVAHGINLEPLSRSANVVDYRRELDRLMDAYDARLADIASNRLRPSKEGRMADAQHPQGYFRGQP